MTSTIYGGHNFLRDRLLAPISHRCMTNLFCDVRLLRRIGLSCVDALSSTGFSLCSVDEPQLKPHRLKPVLLYRARLTLCLHAMERANGPN